MGGLALGSDFIMGCDGWEYPNLSDDEKLNATVYRVETTTANTSVSVLLPLGKVADASNIQVNWGDQQTGFSSYATNSQANHTYEYPGVYDIVILNGSGALSRNISGTARIVYPSECLLAIVQLSQQIEKIPARAFRGYENLEFVNLFPYSHLLAEDPRPLDTNNLPAIYDIGELAFANCPKLKYLYGNWLKVRVVGANAFSGSNVETPVALAFGYISTLTYGADQPADSAQFADGNPDLPLVPWMFLIDEINEGKRGVVNKSRAGSKAWYLQQFLGSFPATFVKRFGESGFWDGFSLRACGKSSPTDTEYLDYEELISTLGRDYFRESLSRGFRPYVLGGEIEKLQFGSAVSDPSNLQALPDLSEPFGTDSLGRYLKEVTIYASGVFDTASVSNLVQLEKLDARYVTSLRCTKRLPDVRNSGISQQDVLLDSVVGAFTFVAKFSLLYEGYKCRIYVATPFVEIEGFVSRYDVNDDDGWQANYHTVSTTRQDKPRVINLPGYTSEYLMGMNPTNYTVAFETIGTITNLSNDVPNALKKAGVSDADKYFRFPFGAPITTVFSCSDKDVKYVSGRWQAVAKS